MYSDLESQAQLLVTWVKEMQAIVSNPYASGLNIDKVLTDLQGYADNLYKTIQELKTTEEVTNEDSEKAE